LIHLLKIFLSASISLIFAGVMGFLATSLNFIKRGREKAQPDQNLRTGTLVEKSV